MFAWLFRPTCPCDAAAKQWVEERLQWLVQQFGLHILLEKDVILPTEKFFPDPYDGTPKTARVLFDRVCGYMNVDPEAMVVKFVHDDTPQFMHQLDPTHGFAAATWSGGKNKRGTVRIEQGGLDRPDDLIGVLAHELSHQKLLGEGRLSPSAFDNELLTDLTAVYHGFGVFLANNTRKHTGKLAHWPGTQLRRPEYLSEPMLGYALAHIAWHRDEDRPAWARHLGWTPRGVFHQGLRYLQAKADSSFPPVRLRQHKDED